MAYYNYPFVQNMSQMPQQVAPVQSPFVTVRNELEAKNYPVAFGNSVMFKDETAPYVYTKTMGFSQLDKPVFEKYRLIKEEAEEEPVKESVSFKDQIDGIEAEIKSMWKEIDYLKDRRKGRNDEHSSNGKSN